MAFDPVRPATLTWGANDAPSSPTYGDVYHPAAGAAGQAQHVFLGGNRLPERWRGKHRFVILETGFGLGNNFLATWQAWRDDASRCDRLHFISIEKHPLIRVDLARAHASSPWPDLAQQLIAAWPPLTPDLHRRCFDGARVELLLALGDAQRWLPQLVAAVDAFYLDGFAPARNPEMWAPRIFKALARLAAPGATLSTWSVAKAVSEGLRSAGFAAENAPGFAPKREMTQARFDPHFTPRRPAARQQPEMDMPKHAVIVGAGLAGCATAWALSQQGWTSTLLDRRDAIAAEASGNPAGAFHGVVNPQDGAHARFNRAAALHVQEVVAQALQNGVAGTLGGLLRLASPPNAEAAMRETLCSLGLPEDYVQVLGAAQASQLAGVTLQHPAWFYPGGGWVDPAGLARDFFLRECRGACTFRARAAVASIERRAERWRLLDADGKLIEATQTLVLCNASDALRLLERAEWPLRSWRGQVSMLPSTAWSARGGGPRVAITGDGFVLPEVNGQILFGATTSIDDDDPRVRDADHNANLHRLARLCPAVAASPTGHSSPLRAELEGRVGWRCSSSDRLPAIGAVPCNEAAPGSRQDQPRLIAREAGLFVFIGLGSRGITWSALGGRLIAALITGAPAPLPAGLVDAVDPARFVTRLARRPRPAQGAGVPGVGADSPASGSAGPSS